MINDYEGEHFVKIAREAVETYIRRAMVPAKDDRIVFSDKMGVFVTLNHLNEKGEELAGLYWFPAS